MDHENRMQLEGKNTVWEALKAGRTIERIYIQKDMETGKVRQIIGLAKRSGIIVDYVPKVKLDKISQTGKHQGLIATIPSVEYKDFDQMIQEGFAHSDAPLFIALDEIQDPHNLGAIIRSAECAGACGIIVTERRTAPLSATTYKASAGAIEHIGIARVKNLAAAVDQMKEAGLWIVGSDAKGNTMDQVDMTGPMVIVIGSEGQGIRRLVLEKCDHVASIPMLGKVNSLNASVAAGILMFESVRQRQAKG